MKTQTEISLFLQSQCGKGSDPERPLVVTFSRANYGRVSSVTLEAAGSPPKGMAVIRPWSELEDCKPGEADVWLLRRGGTLKRMVIGCANANALVSFAQSVLPKP